MLILVGTLLGVLASFLLPSFTSQTPTVEDDSTILEVTPEPTATDDLEMSSLPPITTIAPIPTATPSALLGLKWNMTSVNSPVSFFSSYRLYYPTTWSIKEYKNTPGAGDSGSSTLTLVKDDISLNILQASGDASSCLFPGEADQDGMLTRYGAFRQIQKSDLVVWRWAETLSPETPPLYRVCENKQDGYFAGMTSIGFVEIKGVLGAGMMDEINYILEKIVIIK